MLHRGALVVDVDSPQHPPQQPELPHRWALGGGGIIPHHPYRWWRGGQTQTLSIPPGQTDIPAGLWPSRAGSAYKQPPT